MQEESRALRNKYSELYEKLKIKDLIDLIEKKTEKDFQH